MHTASMHALAELLPRVAAVAMIGLAACGGSKPDVWHPVTVRAPNPHVYSSPMFVANGVGWTSPKWNTSLGVYANYVSVLVDTDIAFTVKALRAPETILFAVKIVPDTVTIEQLRDVDMATYRSIAGTQIDKVVAANAMGKLLGEDTIGYSGHATNGSRFEQYMSRRGRCVFSIVVGIPGAKEDDKIAKLSDELMRLRVLQVDASLGAGGALCNPAAAVPTDPITTPAPAP
jgi:hypothetical protein